MMTGPPIKRGIEMTMTELLGAIGRLSDKAGELETLTDNQRLQRELRDLRLTLNDAAGAIELELESVA